MESNRYAGIFQGIKDRVLPGIRLHDKQSRKLLKLLQEFAKDGMSIEDVIVGLIVIYMNIEGHKWEDFWIVVSKLASGIPALLDSEESE
jgi:hypothetical protein